MDCVYSGRWRFYRAGPSLLVQRPRKVKVIFYNLRRLFADTASEHTSLLRLSLSTSLGDQSYNFAYDLLLYLVYEFPWRCT